MELSQSEAAKHREVPLPRFVEIQEEGLAVTASISAIERIAAVWKAEHRVTPLDEGSDGDQQ